MIHVREVRRLRHAPSSRAESTSETFVSLSCYDDNANYGAYSLTAGIESNVAQMSSYGASGFIGWNDVASVTAAYSNTASPGNCTSHGILIITVATAGFVSNPSIISVF